MGCERLLKEIYWIEPWSFAPVELLDQLLHLGQAEVGDDNPIFPVAEYAVDRDPSVLKDQLFLLDKIEEVKSLPSVACVKGQHQAQPAHVTSLRAKLRILPCAWMDHNPACRQLCTVLLSRHTALLLQLKLPWY